MRVIERRDQRLNHAQGTVESASVAPGFEVMRFGDVPVAKFRSLVKMRAEVNRVLDFLAVRFRIEFYFGSKIKVVRRGVNRIDAQNQQSLHFAGIDIGAELAQ